MPYIEPQAKNTKWPESWQHADSDFIYPDSTPQYSTQSEIYDPLNHEGIDWLCPGNGCGAHLSLLQKNQENERVTHWKAHNNIGHTDDCEYKTHDVDPNEPLLISTDFTRFEDPNSPETLMNILSERSVPHVKRHPAFDMGKLNLVKSFRMNSAKIFKKLAKWAGYSNVMSYVFNVHGKFIKGDDLFFHYKHGKTPGKLNELYNRLAELPIGNHIPVIMEFQLDEEQLPSKRSSAMTVTSKHLFHSSIPNPGNRNISHFIAPKVRIANSSVLPGLQEAFSRAGTYAVMGFVSLEKGKAWNNIATDHMTVTIYDPSTQIWPWDIPKFFRKEEGQPSLPFDKIEPDRFPGRSL